jgi:hypothetical protein
MRRPQDRSWYSSRYDREWVLLCASFGVAATVLIMSKMSSVDSYAVEYLQLQTDMTGQTSA